MDVGHAHVREELYLNVSLLFQKHPADPAPSSALPAVEWAVAGPAPPCDTGRCGVWSTSPTRVRVLSELHTTWTPNCHWSGTSSKTLVKIPQTMFPQMISKEIIREYCWCKKGYPDQDTKCDNLGTSISSTATKTFTSNVHFINKANFHDNIGNDTTNAFANQVTRDRVKISFTRNYWFISINDTRSEI